MMRILICLLLQMYMLAIFGRVLLSWFPLNPNGLMATVGGFLHLVTDPVMKPVQRSLPPVRFGGFALDLSAIVVIVAIVILRAIIC